MIKPPTFKPMLASQVHDLGSLKFPIMCSPKLDGIRAICGPEGLLSRSLKPIRNRYIQGLFAPLKGSLLDGELIVGPPTAKDTYNRTNSGVMSFEGEPEITFHVFDRVGTGSWMDRYYCSAIETHTHLTTVPHKRCNSIQDIESEEEFFLSEGYEGAMLRDPEGIYKYGRSSVKEGLLLKLKRFTDGEAVITGLVPKFHNANPEQINELGYMKRSKVSSGLVMLDTLGALVVTDCVSGIEFQIGTGFTDEMRKSFWGLGESLIGEIVKYKSFDHGVKERPRHPVFLGFRSSDDMAIS